ncbi:MAG: T9SS type A sorting domain-containing protein [bacterium]|nr:T9SS type A sorting domain-containing protein [bacterium]
MKAFGWFALVLLMVSAAQAELDTLWTRRLDLSVNSYAVEAATLLNDGQTMAAAVGDGSGEVDFWRYDLTGDLVWSNSITVAPSYFTILCMEQLRDGNIMLAGVFWSNNDSAAYLLVRCMNEIGGLISERQYPFFVNNQDADLVALSDGGAALITSTFYASNPSQAFLIRLTANADTLYTRTLTLPAQTESYGYAISEFGNGDLLIGGSFFNGVGTLQAFAQRTNPLGEPIWTRTYVDESGLGLQASCLDIDNEENIVVGGYRGFMFWLSYPWAVGLASNGDLRWTLTGLEEITSAVTGIRCLIDGGALLAGAIFADFGWDQIQINTVNGQGVASLDNEYDCNICRIISVNNAGPRGAVAFGRVTDEDFSSYGLLMRFGPSTTISGTVSAAETNAPLAGVRVELLESADFAYTDEHGVFTVAASLATGTLRLSSPCVTTREQQVQLVEGEENVVNFMLGVPEFHNPVSSVNMVATYGMWERDTLTVLNSGTGVLSFTATAVELLPTYDWLQVSPAIGEIAVNGSAEIIVSVLANPEFPDADLAGVIRIHTNSCPDTQTEVGVFVLALDSPERPGPVTAFALHPAYPNPFNASTRVRLDLPQPAVVKAVLYDITGREVSVLTNDHFAAGSHQLTVAAPDLATGMYLLRLTAGASVATQKIVLLK